MTGGTETAIIRLLSPILEANDLLYAFLFFDIHPYKRPHAIAPKSK